MRFHATTTIAVLFALAMLLSGCSWLPEYMKAKAAINARYEKKEEKIEQRYARGEISDETYDRLYEELYAAWDQELTVAKAKAQGYEISSSQGSSRRRRSSSAGSTAGTKPGTRFDTYTAEYVGSGSRDSGSANSSTSSSQ